MFNFWTTFWGIIVLIVFFLLMIKIQDKFWLGFLFGVVTTITLGGAIIVIIQQEKKS